MITRISKLKFIITSSLNSHLLLILDLRTFKIDEIRRINSFLNQIKIDWNRLNSLHIYDLIPNSRLLANLLSLGRGGMATQFLLWTFHGTLIHYSQCSTTQARQVLLIDAFIRRLNNPKSLRASHSATRGRIINNFRRTCENEFPEWPRDKLGWLSNVCPSNIQQFRSVIQSTSIDGQQISRRSSMFCMWIWVASSLSTHCEWRQNADEHSGIVVT